jgi:hypothetical protein
MDDEKLIENIKIRMGHGPRTCCESCKFYDSTVNRSDCIKWDCIKFQADLSIRFETESHDVCDLWEGGE